MQLLKLLELTKFSSLQRTELINAYKKQARYTREQHLTTWLFIPDFTARVIVQEQFVLGSIVYNYILFTLAFASFLTINSSIYVITKKNFYSHKEHKGHIEDEKARIIQTLTTHNRH